jgi:NAD(P)H-hydrate epimerase
VLARSARVIPVLSRAQIRAFDAHAIGAAKVLGVVLMENAGRGAADAIERALLDGSARGKTVSVVAGTGNNGGDGFVVARHLALRGARVHVFLAGSEAKVRGDARANLDAWRGLGHGVVELTSDLQPLHEAVVWSDAVVDALFGTGFDRPLDAAHAAIVAVMNESRAKVAAIDIPSGLDADTGRVLGAAVRASLTVTFAHRKLGLMTPNGAAHAGAIVVVDIGVPADLVKHTGVAAHVVEASDLHAWLAQRAADAHKNTAGHVGVIAGSPGKIGAALMVAHAALRAGAGLATIATWPEAASAIETRVREEMTARLDRSSLAASIDAALAGKRAAVVGPGFGLDADARLAVEHVVATFAGPLVVDADALTHFAGRPEALAVAKRAILTPHPGEAARLLGKTAAQVEDDRFAAARELGSRARAVVVLKGAHTIVADPDGRLVVNATGNAALATAGSGDVLGGVAGALACALDPFEAACAGVYVHGAAADAWRDANGGADRGLLASEIADLVPAALAACVRDHTDCSR